MAQLSKTNRPKYFQNLLLSISGIVLLLLTMLACGQQEEVRAESPDFSYEVEEALRKRMEFVQQAIAEDPRVIELIEEANRKNSEVPLSEIEKLDSEWMASEGITEFIKGFLTNEASRILLDFQDANDGYPEIFVTDSMGLVVGLTNKTSDYYQADEGWWTDSYNNGQGKAFHGEIEFDESALSESIALYIPVMSANDEIAIGVIKVVVDITAIKMDL